MSDEKTEQPTAKRLRDAREDGEVATSPDVTVAAVFIAITVLLSTAGNYFGDHLRALLAIGVDIGAAQRDTFELHRALGRMAIEGACIAGPFVAVAALAAIAGSVCQAGLVLSLEPVMPKLDAINPATGLRKIFSMRTVIDLLKLLVKAIVVGVVLWQGVLQLLPLILGVAHEPLADVVQIGWRVLCRFTAIACALFVVVGAADWGIQRWLFVRDHRMSKDEVKREFKDVDGNQEIKGERRKIAHELIFGDPRQRVAQAKAVVVNPTHYAVALGYDADALGVPHVLAKGVDDAALQLRAYAIAHGVPIIANPPLARALHRVDIDAPIPEALFEAVAAVLKWVDDLGRPADGDAPAQSLL
ncbi:EscU/YscU/HrcU family type III secretion system export apparatus switch protein [Burkholderia pyrrocinia]|uniref:Secretion apparatus protein BsaZ n=1 Tax=Burkholderia pyrrocinia TaxID=60550 RepID=A0A2Z5N878_BURPY|nr:type III secretion system export apparatus subunit SctU [Burkholderia pyrrocinia]AXF25791.1 EscU/YscU/HrcU family type III secretion system export apparatus switch protein [Burkholderia pyrrocinia]